jgi:hypothetical protein
MLIRDCDEDDQHVRNHSDYLLYHNVNEQRNDDDDNLNDDDDDDYCKNDMDDGMSVDVLEMDFEENDEY